MIFKLITLLSSIVLIVSACEGGGGGSNSTSEGINVTFTANHHQSPTATGEIPILPAGEKTFFNTEGVKITLKQAYLVIWSVKLETNCNTSSFAQWLPNWLDLFFPPLFAHAVTTPTQLGVPNVINLLTADSNTITLGTVYPAPASYCGLVVELMKADEDAQYLPKEVDMVNRVLYLSGEYWLPGTTTPTTFVIDLAKTPRPHYAKFPQLLVLSSDYRTAITEITLYYDRWFDAIDFSQLNEEFQQDWLLNQITESIQVKN